MIIKHTNFFKKMQFKISLPIFLSYTLLMVSSVQSQDSIFNAVPMQGKMLMPAIRYMSAHGHLMVTLPNETPHLTPLEESHPDTHFALTSPWYDDLDPETQGMAFNRQYGFVMDGASDLLPLGMAVWIRMLSSDHGLEVYQYRNISETEQIWEPMFITNGSSEVFEWNMKMFHPAFVGPRNSGAKSAEFEAYVVDTDTSERVQEIDGASFTLTWTAARPEGMPVLSISQKIVLNWEGAFGHHMLQSTHDLDSGEWSMMHVNPTLIDGKYTVILDGDHHGMYFRLAPHAP